MHLCSMRLINVKAFLERENLIRGGMPVDHRTKVLEFGDDEVNQYAILSHRWMAQEVDYDEMVRLTKMDGKERDEIRQRGGYRKILQSCERAQEDRYEWLWVDTCCVDKRSSAELSEAINSMYRLYENAKVCYAYLHDVHDSRFPTESDIEKYPDFRGWPEWFSRGWTLQELIAPSNVQFFNKDWQSISDKRALAPTLRNITGIPEPILIHGLCENRPCVAQIMSWAAHRTTTRVEDRAYSLMGLLDVNMPMLYGEGKKAFHRLQLEIIRASNDQSIFAWLHRIAKEQRTSILADDPSFFHDCGRMELIDHDEFIQFFKEDVSKEELGSIEDRLSTFPVTNRGIHIWVLLRPYRGTDTFQAWLPCRRDRQDQSLVAINLALWKSNYYRCSEPTPDPGELPPRQLRQVYLRYQDPSHCHTTFEIDDHALTENGFTFCDAYPKNTTSGDTFTLTTTNAICVKAYAHSLTNHRFAVGLGRSFGKGWIRVVSDEFNIPREGYARRRAFEMRVKAPEHAQHRNKACSGAERYGQICIMRTRLPQTAKILQTSSVMWKSSKMRGVKLEVFHDSGLSDVLGEWTAFDVDVGSLFARLMALIPLFI